MLYIFSTMNEIKEQIKQNITCEIKTVNGDKIIIHCEGEIEGKKIDKDVTISLEEIDRTKNLNNM